jgi:hypothetical protein
MSARRCPRCGGDGPFNANRAQPDGLSVWCRACIKSWRATPEGFATRAWNSINQRAGNRSGRHPAYAKIEVRISRAAFVAWAIPAVRAWLEEHPGGSPSVDRIRVRDHYEAGNLRILSRRENLLLGRRRKNQFAPSGMRWCGMCEDYVPRGLFSKNRTKHEGLHDACAPCVNRNRRSEVTLR